MSTYKISVIMPSLNEEKNLSDAVQNVIDGFNQFGIQGEIVVVNDGSTDNTGKIAVSLSGQYPFLQVIHHDTPQGIGASFWDGVWKSKGEIVTMIPGDGENEASETLRYLPLMEQVDILIPYVFNKTIRSWKRQVLSRLYRGIINLSFALSLNYMNGTVMYRKCILGGITFKSKGFFYQTELLIKTIRKGYLYAEVPYSLSLRAGGESKATTLKSLKKVARNYLSVLADVYLAEKKEDPLDPDSVSAERWRQTERKTECREDEV